MAEGRSQAAGRPSSRSPTCPPLWGLLRPSCGAGGIRAPPRSGARCRPFLADVVGHKKGPPQSRPLALWGEEAQRSGRAFHAGGSEWAQLVPTTFGGSILERDKAVISPPVTPPRNAGRKYGFIELSTALNHLSATSKCHHFLDDAIKSVINIATHCGVAAVIQVSKVLSNPLLAEIRRFINARRKSEIFDADRPGY